MPARRAGTASQRRPAPKGAGRRPKRKFLEKLWQSYGSQAEIWILIEMWSTGFSISGRAAKDEHGPAHQAMITWAQSYKTLFMGSLKVRTPTGTRTITLMQ